MADLLILGSAACLGLALLLVMCYCAEAYIRSDWRWLK